MTGIVYIACSLNGYIADSHGGLDWLTGLPNENGSDFGFAAFLAGIDAVLMGRKTFESVLDIGFWPYIKPVFVYSNNMTTIPKAAKDKAEPVSGTPSEIAAMFDTMGLDRVYIDGGQTIRGFLSEGFIEEMTITTAGIILGGGTPLFKEGLPLAEFSLVSTEILTPRLVKNVWKRMTVPLKA